jgi:hypothetical protein
MNDMMDAAGVPAGKRRKVKNISGPTPAPQSQVPSGHVQHVLVRIGKDGSEEDKGLRSRAGRPRSRRRPCDRQRWGRG